MQVWLYNRNPERWADRRNRLTAMPTPTAQTVVNMEALATGERDHVLAAARLLTKTRSPQASAEVRRG